MADTINTQSTETISLMTNTLHIHLNIGQQLTINSSSVFLSAETTSISSLSNKLIQQIGDAQIRIPSSFSLTTDDNSAISLRVCFYHLYKPRVDWENRYINLSKEKAILSRFYYVRGIDCLESNAFVVLERISVCQNEALYSCQQLLIHYKESVTESPLPWAGCIGYSENGWMYWVAFCRFL